MMHMHNGIQQIISVQTVYCTTKFLPTFSCMLFTSLLHFLTSVDKSFYLHGTLTVLVMTIDALEHFEYDNYNTVRRDGGCRVGKVRASTTSPMPDNKGFKLQ